MKYQHQNLSSGKWFKLDFREQMANIGSEIERTIIWQRKNQAYSQKAFERGLELLDLTIADPKNIKRLKELLRLREVLADYFVFDNIYHSKSKDFKKYFYSFNYAARINY